MKNKSSLLIAFLMILFSCSTLADMVKKSPLGVCHDKYSSGYPRLANFEAFGSLGECLASGGKLPTHGGQGRFDLVKKSPLNVCHDESSPSYSRLTNYESFDSLDECLASGGRLPSNGGHTPFNLVKKSSKQICHDQYSPSYSRVKNFVAFDSLDACLDSGGRMPKNHPGYEDNQDSFNLVKKSLLNVCHDEYSSSFSRLIKFEAYDSLEECLASGGSLPGDY